MSVIYTSLALLAFICLLFQYILYIRTTRKREDDQQDEIKGNQDPLEIYQNIESLRDFDWKTTEPLKLRPFKPTYHLTMGLETIPLSDLIQIDNTYLSRIKLRREIMAAHPKSTLACNPGAEPATSELYEWLIGTYLPKRYPTCFTLVGPEKQDRPAPDSGEQQQHSNEKKSTDATTPTHILNKITSETIPLQAPSDPLKALHTISSQIDTDFLILLPQPPSPPPQNQTKTPSPSLQTQQQETQHAPYHLSAFATTFPSGFSTLSKLSLPLREIHTPVPGYAAKLARSMDRFFARLESGKLVRRANWTVTSTPDLFTESGTHSYAHASSPEEHAASLSAQQSQLNIEDMRLRSELQTLHRLPHTGALVFAFKTYTYTLKEVRDEGGGSAEALAEATEGFVRGSVPGMEGYKRADVWGPVVREFLRGGDGDGKKEEEGEGEGGD